MEAGGGQAGSVGVGGQGLGGTDVIASTAAAMPVGRLQCQDLEGSEWGGTRLGGNHAAEASHRPCPHVVAVGTNWRARGQELVRPGGGMATAQPSTFLSPEMTSFPFQGVRIPAPLNSSPSSSSLPQNSKQLPILLALPPSHSRG